MAVDNNTGKNKEFYKRGKEMFDQIKPHIPHVSRRLKTLPSSKNNDRQKNTSC